MHEISEGQTMAAKVRTLRLADGSMTSFRLDEVEWKAIERAADAHGQSWTDWARMVFDAHPDAPNRVALLRRVVMEEAFGQALLAERMELMDEGREVPHPMLERRFRPLGEEALQAEFELLKIDYRADFQSFELIAGHRGNAPVLIVRNKLEDALSFLLSRDPIDDEGQDDEVFDNLTGS